MSVSLSRVVPEGQTQPRYIIHAPEPFVKFFVGIPGADVMRSVTVHLPPLTGFSAVLCNSNAGSPKINITKYH